MKKMFVLMLVVLGLAALATAQITTVTTDVLGAHLNYGRGCAGCHAPHSGAWGNGANASGDKTSGDIALWGQDTGNLYGKTIKTGRFDFGVSYTEVLPSSMAVNGTPDTMGLLTCLSCHDGNWAQGAMMKNAVFETLPSTYGTKNTIPTLLGNDGNGLGDYLNDHPVGLNAAIGCGGAYNWDCTIVNGVVTPTGPNMQKFIQNYGFFVAPAAYNNNAVVLCTTCHDQHVMNIVPITQGVTGGGTQLPTGTYATMFFVRAPYNPNDTTPGANQTAQFCRQCHGGESNEMNGSTAGTIF
jgi:hypothetical protein